MGSCPCFPLIRAQWWMSCMTGLLYLQNQPFEMKQGRIVRLGTGLRLPLKASVFFLFVFLTLPLFLSSPICPSVCHSDISAFHEHNPPGPELTQLSGPRGKNLSGPVQLKHVCVFVDIPVRVAYAFPEDLTQCTCHLLLTYKNKEIKPSSNIHVTSSGNFHLTPFKQKGLCYVSHQNKRLVL